jgi:hypothetical protein
LATQAFDEHLIFIANPSTAHAHSKNSNARLAVNYIFRLTVISKKYAMGG